MRFSLSKDGMMTLFSRRLIAVAALLVTMSSGALAQVPKPLPPLPGDANSYANAINDSGVVVGRSDDTAVIWDRKRNPKALPPYGSDCCSEAVSINNRGQVLGLSTDGLNISRVVVWDRNLEPSLRPRPPLGDDCESIKAADINNKGEAVGVCGDYPYAAVFWDKHGVPTLLPPLAGDAQTQAAAINYRDEVTGYSFGAYVQTAVRWDKRGNPKALSPLFPNGDVGVGLAINSRGLVAGESGYSGGDTYEVVVWDRQGTPMIRQRPPISDDCESVVVRGISNIGEIVGFCIAHVDSIHVGVLWDRSGTPLLLSPLTGDTDSVASGINNRGEVVGVSRGSGVQTAVVWR